MSLETTHQQEEARQSVDDEWHSTWQTNDKQHAYAWTRETMHFFYKNDGTVEFLSEANDLRYKWIGSGVKHRDSYMAGTWYSDHKNAKSAGAFILHETDSQGEIRTGFLLGSDKQGRENYGAWVLVKKGVKDPEQAIDAAKERLALNMCPGLGDLIVLSKGQFMGKFLHPEIGKSALALFENATPLQAVNTVLTDLQNYIQKASGLNLSGAALMKQAFAVGSGPLSDGQVLDKTHKSNQEYLLELFLGSLFFRNKYIKEFPQLTTEDAIPLLMFCSLLYKMVDQQRQIRLATPNSQP